MNDLHKNCNLNLNSHCLQAKFKKVINRLQQSSNAHGQSSKLLDYAQNRASFTGQVMSRDGLHCRTVYNQLCFLFFLCLTISVQSKVFTQGVETLNFQKT